MGVLEFLALWLGMIYYFAAGAVLNVRDAPDVALACLGSSGCYCPRRRPSRRSSGGRRGGAANLPAATDELP